MLKKIIFWTRQIWWEPSYNPFPEDKALELLDYAYLKWIKSFDTAPIYWNGNSEAILWKFIKNNIDKHWKTFRQDIKIISKFWIRIKENWENYFCFKRDSIIEELSISLKRLNTDYLDIYLLHIPDNNMNVSEIIETLNYLQNIWKIKSYGICNSYSGLLLEFINHPKSNIEYVQDFYNLIEKKAEKLIFPYIKNYNIKFLAYSPLYRGLLTDISSKSLLQKNENAINRLIKNDSIKTIIKKRNLLIEVSKIKNISLEKLAIDFLSNNKNVDSILFWTTSIKHLDIFLESYFGDVNIINIEFDNSYIKLPRIFYEHVLPAKISNPKLIKCNYDLAKELWLSLELVEHKYLADFFSGNIILDKSEPISQVYAGHQFGYFSPILWDWRAILLWEIIDINGYRKDIQLKWSGVTPFSRNGDGKATLWAVIREYIMSEAMFSLWIPTTRSLAIVSTDELLYRETLLPWAILCRIASSHIRIGTFEYFSSQNDIESLKILADYVIDRHYPESKNTKNPYLSLFELFLDRQVLLMTKWMSVGFIHWVMNTDNISITGETIDYGPCAFLDGYNINKVFSSIDWNNRYSFWNQRYIMQWNLARFWECLLPLIDENIEKSVKLLEISLDNFQEKFSKKWLKIMWEKIWITNPNEADFELINELLDIMQAWKIDYTLCFRYLIECVNWIPNTNFLELFNWDKKIDNWLNKWYTRLQSEKLESIEIMKNMKHVNPAFIPRNHRLEEVIQSAVTKNDFVLMNKLIEVLSNPYNVQEGNVEYMNAPKTEEIVFQTFCGT